ncbi:regulator of G-protein signaling 6-like [Copidosoma floridanum]|uniref:regulator of G-protein signaling 6-like n=1 Tax=Copidosoma floridanum TaxID=29053 RepID=UPI0006C95F93|nr:regulator of G-protein signaling 6-like [Copidosoma floridanum]
MEASNTQLYKEKEQRTRRPCAFDKMEELVREMQDPDNGVPVRSQKVFLTLIPAAFMGYDLIEWLMERLNIEESVEAVHIANQLCQYGYFFPVNDSRTLTVKDDSSLYRFQTPYYWPWQHRQPDNVEYAIYLSKRTLRNKQRHGLEDYELTALNEMKKNLQNKWDVIQLQAGEQMSDLTALNKVASRGFLPCKKITEMIVNHSYMVTKLKKVNTKYGIKAVVELNDEFQLFLPSAMSKNIVDNKGRGVINTFINKLPVELQVAGYQHCGPCTKLAKRLAHGDPGMNLLDEACKQHEIAYSQNPNEIMARNVADKILSEKAWQRLQA